MKKLLLLILIALLLALSIFIVIQGVEIGKIEVLGIKEIQEKNSELDAKIKQAGKLAEKDYQQAVSEVETNTKKLKEEKKNYEDMTAISEEGDAESVNQIEKYEIETLWVRLGNHATSEGVVMQMDVLKGNNSVQDVYNLKFTATGGYIQITDFISAIENDSTLGFKIEEFKMIPATNSNDLQATFVCKDIYIKDVSASTTDTATNENTQADSNNITNPDNTTTIDETSNLSSTTNIGNTNVTE